MIFLGQRASPGYFQPIRPVSSSMQGGPEDKILLGLCSTEDNPSHSSSAQAPLGCTPQC